MPTNTPWYQELGSELGSMFIPGGSGGKIGGLFGKGLGAIGKGIGSIFGSGDYTIQSNSLMKNGVPSFNNSNGSTPYRHREYLGDILSSTGFSITSYDINPGLNNTFPWLYGMADQFQEYQIHGMVFCFKSKCGDAISSTNNAMGTVIMSTQYNPLDPVFDNKITMENHQFTTSDKPSLDLVHGIECKRGQSVLSNLYVRTPSTNLGTSDIRLYDFAKFSIATVGMQQAGVNIGELWVTYDITLLKPKLNTSPYQPPSYLASLTGASVSQYCGSSQTVTNNSLNLTVSANSIKFPSTVSGNFIVALYYAGASTANCCPPSVSFSLGASMYTPTNMNSNESSTINATETVVISKVYVTIKNGGTITYNQLVSYNLPGTLTQQQLSVVPVQ